MVTLTVFGELLVLHSVAPVEIGGISGNAGYAGLVGELVLDASRRLFLSLQNLLKSVGKK